LHFFLQLPVFVVFATANKTANTAKINGKKHEIRTDDDSDYYNNDGESEAQNDSS
jgi:hypothetical protein